ncbi:hypothetical protein [Polyangium sp. y55x31]|uniref:hypothetical protein n=1 Tax=Polyangium sp. y55x31 TaxID=3042688 RepID=UPI00248244F3|nr:hypothetical protein [Polyangium sp. y55x31]MDI1483674.1 hypothetical protein [Polyangium sp. y55x31]
MRRYSSRFMGVVSLALAAQGLLVAACAVEPPQEIEAPAAEPLDPTLPNPECCLHPGTHSCGECIEGSYCDACLCWAPMTPISREMCHYNPPECPLPRNVKHECPQVSAWAKDPVTGLCCYYSLSCRAPVEWDQFYSYDACMQ